MMMMIKNEILIFVRLLPDTSQNMQVHFCIRIPVEVFFIKCLTLFLLTESAIKPVAAASKPRLMMPKNYLRSEDEKILVYIAQKRRFSETGGNLLWKTVEKEKVVPDRLTLLLEASHSELCT